MSIVVLSLNNFCKITAKYFFFPEISKYVSEFFLKTKKKQLP